MMLPDLALLFRLNALYSVTTGSLMVGLHAAVAEALAIPVAVVVILGSGLVGFGLMIGWLSRGRRASATEGLLVAGADAAWVAMVVTFVALSRPPASGVVLALLTSVPVAAFAVLQTLASLRLQAPGSRTIEAERTMNGTPGEVWAVMVDPDIYARLSPNLSRVGPFSPVEGTTATGRRCWDVRGRHWDETLTSWEPGRWFSVEVDTSADDYPYPMAELKGTWSVADAGAGRSVVTMRFDSRPRPGAAGTAFAAALAVTGPRMMRTILAGWESEVSVRREPALRP